MAVRKLMLRHLLIFVVVLFTLEVSAINSSPTNITLSNSAIIEALPVGTLVATLSSIDADLADVHAYSLVAGAGSGGNANFSVVGNQLLSNAIFNFEMVNSYSIRLQSNDGNGGVFEKVFTIQIRNRNDSPTDVLLSNNAVNENVALGFLVGLFSAIDEDVSDSHTFRLVTGVGATDNASFTILGNQLKTVTSFTYSNKNSYSIRVQTSDGKGGIYQKIFTISIVPLPITFNVHPSGATICQTRSHLFKVSVSGTQPISYQWKYNGANIIGATDDSLIVANADISNVGNYQCFVTNPAGTYTSNLVSLFVNATPKISFSNTDVCVGSATAFTNNSTIDFNTIASYTWDFDDNGNQSNLEEPSYVFSGDGHFSVSLIAESDLGCLDTFTKTVTAHPYPNVNFTAGDICFVDTLKPINTSTINFGTMSYAWNFGDGYSTSQINPTHKYVSTDSYIIGLVATSNNGCSRSISKTITVNPSPIANFVVPDICDSTVAKFQGVSSISSGSITHYWDFGDGDTNFNEVNPHHLYKGSGTRSIQLKVISDKMCSDSVIKNIEIFNNPSVVVSVLNASCYGTLTGKIEVQSSLGMAPYFYSLNNGNFTLEPVFNFLAASNYHLKVMDNRNCITTREVEVKQPDPLDYLIANLTNIECSGAQTGSYVVLPKGGTAPYDYYVNFTNEDTDIRSYSIVDTGYISNLKARTYPNYLLDFNGCKIGFLVTVSEPSPITISESHQNVSCKGFSDGFIDVTASGGVRDYRYSISGGLQNQTSNLFTNLNAKDYLISVKDSNGCGASMNVNLLEPVQDLASNVNIREHVSCFGDSTGVAEFNSTGGSGVVKFSVGDTNSFSTQTILSNLKAQQYKVFAKDENGCFDSTSFIIQQPASALSIQNILTNDVKCYGATDGGITVMASGGTGGLKYSINKLYYSSNSFNQLKAGIYNLKVKDANSCVDSQLVSITQPAKMIIDTVIINGVNCKNENSGLVDIQVSGGTYPYQLTLGHQIQNSGIFNTLQGGDHYTSVQDANGCVIDAVVNVPFASHLAEANFHPFVAGKVITFNDLSLNASNYLWDFGDGNQSNLAQPIHQFASNGVYAVKLVVSNACNSDSIVKNINIGYVGLNEVEFGASILLYPNPASSFITIEVVSNENLYVTNSTLKFYNVLGELIDSHKISLQNNQQKFNYNTLNLSSGKYFLRIENERINVVKTFEVIH